MLMDTTPWFLPAMFLSTAFWLVAFQVGPSLESRPWAARMYAWTPPGLLFILLLTRARAIMSLDMMHNEVALSLTVDAAIGERLRLLFTGYGALEGALLSLLLFSLLVPRLPSLSLASDSTKAFVKYRVMTHNAAWVLLGLVLLFPEDAHAGMPSLPTHPTLPVEDWGIFLVVALFALLVMMAGEIVASSSHLASTNETRLLFDRAILKSLVGLVLAWLLLFQTEAFTQTWWARPDHDPRLHAATLVAVYASLMTFMHAFATRSEGLMHHYQQSSRTLAVALGFTMLVTSLAGAWTAHHVDVYGSGTVALFSSWRLASFMMLFGGLLMLLPTVGYDAAHRPEAWWFRMGMMITVVLGPLLSASVWLLIPSLFLAASLHIMLPWWLESEDGVPKSSHRLFSGAVLVVTSLLMLGFAEPIDQVNITLFALALCACLTWCFQRSWSTSHEA